MGTDYLVTNLAVHNSQQKNWMNTFQQDLPLVVVIIILFIDIRDGNDSTNSCGNSPVVDQNVWDFLSTQLL